jgi:hypothetical protein
MCGELGPHDTAVANSLGMRRFLSASRVLLWDSSKLGLDDKEVSSGQREVGGYCETPGKSSRAKASGPVLTPT